jgi:citronellol/citronellal dehydrogenase
VLVAPGPEAGPLRAALENLARTLSVEWARFDVRTTAILPGAETTDEELGTLVAYLASPAGDYYSGCALALGGEKVRG